jgi:Xaa-Pro aminopeptidase
MEKKLNELFNKTKADAILIRNFSGFSDPNFFYFTGLSREKYENNFLVLTKRKVLIISSLLEGAGIPFSRNYSVKTAKNHNEFIRILRKTIKGKVVGLNFDLLPVNYLKKMKKLLKGKKFIDVSRELNEMRAIKTKDEIKKIKVACNITEKTFNEINSFFTAGMTELELASRLEFAAKKLGAEELAFPLIVASGKNSSVPHHNTSTKKIKENELILIDFGVKYKGYCSDLTRMFFSGKTPEYLNELYSEVMKAKQSAEKALGEGKNFAEAFRKADSFMQKHLGQKLIHDIGHGLGLEVHDFPKKNFGEKLLLKENMVLTLEPGYYNAKIGGIRIEDNYLITKKGFINLSNAPKKITELS